MCFDCTFRQRYIYRAHAYPPEGPALADLLRIRHFVHSSRNTNNQQDTITRVGNELEESAWTKLQTALKIMTQNEVQTDLSTCIDDTPRGAVDALKQVMQALGMCQLRSELWNDAAAKKVRDSLSVRTQLAAFLLGNKKKYHSVLEHAYGEKIDHEENSRLMQSYREIRWIVSIKQQEGESPPTWAGVAWTPSMPRSYWFSSGTSRTRVDVHSLATRLRGLVLRHALSALLL